MASKKRKPPKVDEFSVKFDLDYFRNLMQESDRGCVLLLACRLDELLKELHIRHIRSTANPSNKMINGLLNSNGPLHPLSWRIKLAFAYGLISREDYLDLDALRDMRNKAAHTAEDFTFKLPEIRERVIRFTAPKRLPEELHALIASTPEQRAALASPPNDETTTKFYFLVTGMCLSITIMGSVGRILRKQIHAQDTSSKAKGI